MRIQSLASHSGLEDLVLLWGRAAAVGPIGSLAVGFPYAMGTTLKKSKKKKKVGIVCVCIYIYIYICMYVYMCIYIDI